MTTTTARVAAVIAGQASGVSGPSRSHGALRRAATGGRHVGDGAPTTTQPSASAPGTCTRSRSGNAATVRGATGVGMGRRRFDAAGVAGWVRTDR